MSKALWVVMVWVLVCTWGSSAHAQDDQQDNKALAQEHYNAGLRAYNVGEFDQAIKDWKQAYQYLGAPDFLFNIAQAYRQKREYTEAIFFYNSYLRGKPDAANLAEVTALRDEMVALLKAQESTATLPPTDVVDPNADTTRAETPVVADATERPEQGSQVSPTTMVNQDRSAPSGGESLRLTGMIAGGAGVAFLATGIVFALSASSTESDLERAAAAGEPWSDKFADMESSAESSATIGTVLVVVGVAAMIGGGASYYLGHKKREDARALASGVQVKPTLSLAPEGASAGLGMGWNF